MTTQNSAPRPPRALIAMSGGVDSSVAAWLMQRDGYDCTGITMRLTHNEMLGQSGFHTCCSEKDIEDAAEVAFALDIPLIIPVVGLVYVLEVLSDIIQVVYFKKTHGKRFFRMAPLHHPFELKGVPESKIIIRFWITSILLGLVALSVLKLR